jgi:hypothetical protein
MAMTADQLPDDPDALKAMVLARDIENARLHQIIKELQRHRFGRRAETLPEVRRDNQRESAASIRMRMPVA